MGAGRCCFCTSTKLASNPIIARRQETNANTTQTQVTQVHGSQRTNNLPPVHPGSRPPTILKVLIDTKVSPDDIKSADFTPAATQNISYPYTCPICFKFYSHILVTKCCKNYICHFCAKHLQAKMVNFEIACPHCKSNPVVLTDVDLNDPVKKYSDSPYGTHRSTNDRNKWVPILQMVREDSSDTEPADELRTLSFTREFTEAEEFLSKSCSRSV
ncbi:unnamed protein product [Blepharisma stoltei]|uniref:RING-type domain-containing protein n=1 Tax=Blepharisma stoltei TaxID=1481888 RepID=A0AAU9J6E4_9CILI|nr:unnamed protein product [Blepharisma stoltei]